MKTIYKQISIMYGVTPEEVEKEIKHALSFAEQSPSKGRKKAPLTVEETILRLAAQIVSTRQSE